MRTGTLARVVGLTLEAKGIMAPLGAVCEVVGAGGHRIEAEVVGFQDQAIFLMPFIEPKGVGPGDLVRVTEHTAHAKLGPELLLLEVVNLQVILTGTNANLPDPYLGFLYSAGGAGDSFKWQVNSSMLSRD